VKELTASERHVRLYEEVAIVSVRMRISGKYDGNATVGDFRFTRIWSAAPGRDTWHVVAVHAVLIAPRQ
jgi:hypothetical protein